MPLIGIIFLTLHQTYELMDNYEIISDYYQNNINEMKGFARKIVKNDFIAEDIVQDCFVKMLNIKEYIIQRSLPALVHKTLRNMCFDYIRRSSYHKEACQGLMSTQSAWHDMESEIYAHDISEKLEKGISTMSERYQIIYRMSIYEGKKVADITEALGMSYKATENCLGRARAEMRSFMRMCM